MQRTVASIATGLAALMMAAPALAEGRRDHDDRREWSGRHTESRGNTHGYRQSMKANDHRNERRAYSNGYRDAVRADNHRDTQRYGWNSNGHSNGRNGAPVYYNGNRNWQNAGYQNQYHWGPNGQVQCRRPDGTSGLIVGALAGGTLGNVIAREGDKRLGSVIGGTLGAVLGNELAKGNVRCR